MPTSDEPRLVRVLITKNYKTEKYHLMLKDEVNNEFSISDQGWDTKEECAEAAEGWMKSMGATPTRPQ